jgi:hypothetical protein
MAEREFPGGTVTVMQIDITEMEVDAIVNAANSAVASTARSTGGVVPPSSRRLGRGSRAGVPPARR